MFYSLFLDPLKALKSSSSRSSRSRALLGRPERGSSEMRLKAETIYSAQSLHSWSLSFRHEICFNFNSISSKFAFAEKVKVLTWHLYLLSKEHVPFWVMAKLFSPLFRAFYPFFAFFNSDSCMTQKINTTVERDINCAKNKPKRNGWCSQWYFDERIQMLNLSQPLNVYYLDD